MEKDKRSLLACDMGARESGRRDVGTQRLKKRGDAGMYRDILKIPHF